MRASPHTSALWLLVLATAVLANPFWFRDETSSSTSASATAAASSQASETSTTAAQSSKASETSASTTDTAPTPEATNVNGTAAATNGTTNATAAATSSSGAAATSSAYLADTPEKLRCHVDREDKPADNISPFCKPEEGQSVLVGEVIPVTWDPTLFTKNSTNVVELQWANATNNSQIIGSSGRFVNEQGYYKFPMHDDYLQGGQNGTKLTLFIVSEDDEKNRVIKSGPVFTLIAPPSNGTSRSGGSKDLGEKAGIPVGL
ncbi:MAG: hypothetical protein L6R39_002569, partial [Caloplaca ligustica]